MIDIQKVMANPDLRRIGKVVLYRPSVTSTNRVLFKMAETATLQEGEGMAEGTVLIAEEQVAGRGRLNRVWVSPRGKGLWFSVYLCPEIPPEKTFLITFMGAVAVAEAVNGEYGVHSTIKWPNDVLIQGRKYCGVLTETRIIEKKLQFAILGIGMNLNQTEQEITESYGPIATSLRIVLHRPIDMQLLFESVLLQLDGYYDLLLQGEYDQILSKWREYATFLGTEVTIVSEDEPHTGIARDVDDKGGIIIQMRDGKERTFYSGDLFL